MIDDDEVALDSLIQAVMDVDNTWIELPSLYGEVVLQNASRQEIHAPDLLSAYSAALKMRRTH